MLLFSPQEGGAFEISTWRSPVGIWRCEGTQTFSNFADAERFFLPACIHTGALLVWPAADMAKALGGLKP